MDQTTTDVRLANWKSIVEQCSARPDGISARQWLAQNNIPEKQYYYWQRRVRDLAYKQMQPSLPDSSCSVAPAVRSSGSIAFAEFRTENLFEDSVPAPAVVIRTKKSTIEISSAVPGALMVKLLKAVSHAL